MHIPIAVRLLSGAAFMVLTAGLFFGGAQPEAVGLFDNHWDKVAHFALFALLAALLMLSTGMRHPVLALIGTVIVGISDELAQTRLPGRQADVIDLATDLVGALCAVLLLLAVRRYYLARRGA